MSHYKHPRGKHNGALVHINMYRGEPATSFDKLILEIFKSYYGSTRLRYRGPHKKDPRGQHHTLKKHAYGAALYYR